MKELFDGFLFSLKPIRAVQQFFGQGHPVPFELMSLAGDTWGMMFVIGLALWLWGRDTAYGVAGTIVLGAATKTLLTEVIFSVPRPQGQSIRVYHQVPTGSFPSGHVYMATATWTWLYLRDYVPVIIPILIALLTGLGRIYLGTHYLADIIFGIIFGVLFAIAYYYGWPKCKPWLWNRSMAFYTGLTVFFAAAIVGSFTYMPRSPHRWEVLGVILGIAPGLLLEYRYLNYAPGSATKSRKLLKVVIGLAGLALLYLLDRTLFPPNSLVPGLVATMLGGLWVTCGAPLVFFRMGWSKVAADAKR